MRLIDADAINFNQVFGGNSEFAKDMRDAAQGLIDRQPTAFDKEKVIEELKTEGCIIDDEAGNRAVEIVEKGGIE
ncbi:hypothetical protein LKD70_16420 [Ruminococcus sp. CLA-AA-H200]|uniref:Uncharacterized protein n=1 Tax=Ruminococcus turbiniformis TaxID=2881258 RepID=A0ABS8G0Y5_9FIRM|nr:hypothetical protein [Ruminococcus turbiniformis]MCC2255978.1 hypothetical protein [Ruminococcus turbiniformis]